MKRASTVSTWQNMKCHIMYCLYSFPSYLIFAQTMLAIQYLIWICHHIPGCWQGITPNISRIGSSHGFLFFSNFLNGNIHKKVPIILNSFASLTDWHYISSKSCLVHSHKFLSTGDTQKVCTWNLVRAT